jgi:membrane protease YdiL (CAAX protease family)
MKRGTSIVPLAVAFEGGLGLAAFGLAWWLEIPLARRLDVSTGAMWRGVIGLVPLLAMLAYVTKSRWSPLVELRQQVEQLAGELFQGVPWPGLAAISIAAGVGEELLFRGALQPLAERWFGAAAGVLAVSVIFGALHALSRAYFLLATLVAIYLGWMVQYFDDLIAPMVIHAAYDFVALAVLQRTSRNIPPAA